MFDVAFRRSGVSDKEKVSLMQVTTRRALLAGAGTLAAGTVAATGFLRKPDVPQVHTLAAAGLGGAEGLRPLDPPRIPALARFFDTQGAEQTLAAHAGSGLVVNLWATWCAPCVAEMPALQALAKALAAEGILVLPLSSDRGGAPVVQKFYAANGIDALPVLLDPKGEAARAWSSRGLPTTMIIDRQGQERARLEGGADWAAPEMLAAVRRLVG